MLPLRTVLCALDFSEGSGRALVQAADLSERSHAALHLYHALPLFRARLAATPGGDPAEAFRDRTEAFVNHALGADDAFDVLAPVLYEQHGVGPADGILSHAERIDADLIVASTHSRRGLDRLLIGSVAAEVLRRSPVPVLVVPERAEPVAASPDRPVLVAIDFSTLSEPVLRVGRSLASAYGAPVLLAHIRAVEPDTLVGPGTFELPAHPPTGIPSREDAHAALDRLVLALDAGEGFSPEQYVVPGRPGTALVDLAIGVNAGVIVMGTHGRSGLERVRLGSVAEWVVRHATCPVLALPIAAAEQVKASSSRADASV